MFVRVTPQVVINTQEVRTIRRVGRPRKDRTTSQVVSRRTAISKGSLSTSLVDFRYLIILWCCDSVQFCFCSLALLYFRADND